MFLYKLVIIFGRTHIEIIGKYLSGSLHSGPTPNEYSQARSFLNLAYMGLLPSPYIIYSHPFSTGLLPSPYIHIHSGELVVPTFPPFPLPPLYLARVLAALVYVSIACFSRHRSAAVYLRARAYSCRLRKVFINTIVPGKHIRIHEDHTWG
jgi:hypothetical protein